MTIRQQVTTDILVGALAAGKTLTAAARIAGISQRTAYRRVKDSQLLAKVELRRNQLANTDPGDSPGKALFADWFRLVSLLGSGSEEIRDAAADLLRQLIQYAQARLSVIEARKERSALRANSANSDNRPVASEDLKRMLP